MNSNNYKGHQPRYRAMVTKIAGDIESGELPDGSQLPSTAGLCREYGVSATVVNQAVLVLVEQGLIEGVPGVGRFVKAPK